MAARSRPARLRSGQCPGCGMYDTSSAPDQCARCALERAQDRGWRTYTREQLLSLSGRFRSDELWAAVVEHYEQDRVPADTFYVYVASADGRLLPLFLRPAVQQSALLASEQAAGVTMFAQAWVVTSVGAWQPPPTRRLPA